MCGLKSRQDVVVIRLLEPNEVDACAAILLSLPEWFGDATSNAGYIAALDEEPTLVAFVDGKVRGFVTLRRHGAGSVEIEVMAVERAFQRQSLGRQLVVAAEAWCAARGVAWLHVKTRGPSTFDEFYDRTRQFYRALGFEVLYESLTEWGPQDAALILVKHLSCSSGAGPAE
jgi:GNAT superfamily N-acetyltransferase